MIDRLFTDHPRSVGESYREHFVAAGGFGVTMIGAGIACLIHALLPGLFAAPGSRAITRLHDRMVANRRRHTAGNPSPVSVPAPLQPLPPV